MKLSLSALSAVIVFSSLIRTGTAGVPDSSECVTYTFQDLHEKCSMQKQKNSPTNMKCTKAVNKLYDALTELQGSIGLELNLVEHKEKLEEKIREDADGKN